MTLHLSHQETRTSCASRICRTRLTQETRRGSRGCRQQGIAGRSPQTVASEHRYSDGSDELLGRPHAAEVSFTEAVAADPAPVTKEKTPEERFADLQKMTSTYLSPESEKMLEKAFLFAREAHKDNAARAASRSSRIRWKWPSSSPI